MTKNCIAKGYYPKPGLEANHENCKGRGSRVYIWHHTPTRRRGRLLVETPEATKLQIHKLAGPTLARLIELDLGTQVVCITMNGVAILAIVFASLLSASAVPVGESAATL